MSITEPTVYVVDDDRSFLAAISRLLRAKGFEVKTVSGGGRISRVPRRGRTRLCVGRSTDARYERA